MGIDNWKTAIERATNKIDKLQAMRSSYSLDIEHLANRFKERGDCYINLYLDDYVVHKKVQEEYANKSFKDYNSAIRLFNEKRIDIKSIYSTMALGNAYKEKFVPDMPVGDFRELEIKSRKEYDKCVEFYSKKMDKHTQEYHFVMLEQLNLMVRKNIWEKKLRPRRVVILHSLKSPESHMYLEGACYYAYRHDCEVWEYRFGKVKTFDNEEKFIKDRLSEACAVVFLASNDYSQENPIIKFEIDTVFEMKKRNDPIRVFMVDLGNQQLVESLEKEEIGEIISKDEIKTIFTQYKINDIYECRRLRCNN
ncbi:hypothetical protein BMS3Abin15_00139 [bacterium BMS3Abin15]|nr:hypothetical protein BMS3Abin15_00139 [bacterium BMS3Abin15]GBE39186.1 hypothetical protein BMS3Bbin08_01806 [bacterium BMS3Bbin08]